LLERLGEAQPFEHVVVKRDVGRDDLLRVEEVKYDLPGVFTNVRPTREYPYGEVAGQLLGYMGEIGKAELAAKQDRYHLGDLVGKSGLEAVYEETMRGRDGRTLVNVYRKTGRPQARTDAYGRPYFELDRYGNSLAEESSQRVEPSPGDAVYTTLDVGLQAYCESLLEGEIGAIAVLNAETGAVLALASTPRYDPTVFVQASRSQERVALFDKDPNPMRNRCYQERYPPGSTYKVMLAAAALEEGIVDEQTTFHCPGFFRLSPGTRPWRCWKRGGHGGVNIVDALAYSCDVYFYNVGVKLGVDKMKEWSTRMGLGVPTGIDLTNEVPGLIPDPEWREAIMRKQKPDDPSEWRWYPGHTVNLSIGQGDAAVTPLQTAVMTACILNGGRLVRPYVNEGRGPALSEPFLSESTLDIVQRGMLKCVEKETFPSGTGRRAKIEGMKVLGKTGTAQAVGIQHYDHYENEEDIPYEIRDHAWFVAGTMEEEPPLAIGILIEHGLHGSSAASPLAKDIIEYYYGRRDDGRPVLVAREEAGP